MAQSSLAATSALARAAGSDAARASPSIHSARKRHSSGCPRRGRGGCSSPTIRRTDGGGSEEARGARLGGGVGRETPGRGGPPEEKVVGAGAEVTGRDGMAGVPYGLGTAVGGAE